MAQTGNSANHEVQGLTVVGQLAIGNPGDGDFAVLQTDGSGNLYINGVQFDPDGGGAGASGAAGGALAGTYPDPTIAAGAVGSAEISALIKDPATGTAGLRTLGTGSTQAAAGDHTHAASGIVSGTVATARLGSGTANSGTYLRGDQTWASISSTSQRTATKVIASSTAGSAWNADITCDGTADHLDFATAIAALPSTGGRILLSEGVFSVDATTALTTGVCFEGQGPGTIIDVSTSWSGSNTGVFTLANSSVHACQIKNLTIRGNSRGTNVDGIFLNNSGGSFTAAPDTSPDAEHLLQNLLILTPSGCGIRSASSGTAGESTATITSSTLSSSSGNARGTWIDNVFVFYAGRNGLFWHAPDSFISNFVCGASQRSGIIARGGNVRYTGCKSYYSVWHGFVMEGNRSEFANCEAQDNLLNGFYMTGTQITASGLLADSNGGDNDSVSVGDGFYINCTYSNIEGVAFDRNENASNQRYGATFGGSAAKNNIMLSIDVSNFSAGSTGATSGSLTGQLTLFITTNGLDSAGNDATVSRFGAGRTYINAPNIAPVAVDIGQSDATFWIDETISARPKLKATFKKASGSTTYVADMTRQDVWNFSDEVITPGGIPLYLIATSASAIATAGTIYGARCRAPKSGDIRGVYVWIGTSSGNLRGGIYTTPLTAALVWDGGSVASPGNNQWMDLGDPGAGVAPVVEGDYFDIVVVADNTTVTVGRTAGAAFAHGNVNNLHSDFAKLAASGGNTKLNWLYAAGAYAALPATITDGNRVVDNHDIAIIARIA